MDINEITLAVHDFKNTVQDIELQRLGHEFRKFKRFPQACCVMTSHLLSRFLIRKFPLHSFKIVNGEPNGFSHYWIESNGKVIDITMNQKGISLSDVIFSESKWHSNCRILNEWNVTSEFHDVDEGADRASSSTLEIGYKLIISNMDAVEKI
ncbi:MULTISPECIES: hypothetical protein [Pseudoalteromonas]|uniref:Microcin J25-processing protein McjB C-terminal domain-containing protein n=1 Tax=Pseudoalteromonas arctica TaxID=394751 RepID=A0ABU9TLR9_9GAMM|nr:hypothetical protein [Pseudoalteromonas sp. BSi20429]GAA66133.1 hypothetical protein P20429_0231 [Pseudoalteromonas sp. BSi20429]